MIYLSTESVITRDGSLHPSLLMFSLLKNESSKKAKKSKKIQLI